MNAPDQQHVVGLQIAMDEHPRPSIDRPDFATHPAQWRAWADEHVACAGETPTRRCYLPRVDGSDRCVEHAERVA